MDRQWNDKQLVKAVADLVSCGLVVLSADRTIEVWNHQLQQMTGFSAGEVKSRPWSAVAAKVLADGG